MAAAWRGENLTAKPAEIAEVETINLVRNPAKLYSEARAKSHLFRSFRSFRVISYLRVSP